MKPATKEAVKLMHEGALALSQVEANGFQIDLDYLDRTIVQTRNRVKRYEEHLIQSKIGKLWKKTYGDRMKWDATNQLAVILFDKLGFECHSRTKHGQKQADKTALQRIDIPFTRDYLKMRSLSKIGGTYLQGIRSHVGTDGLLHAVQSLHLTVSFRPTISEPNLANVPVRNKKTSRIVRRAFVPFSKHFEIAEMDMSGAEVRVGACYHKDPLMLRQIKTHFDPHRTLATHLYGLELDQVSGPLRQEVKGDFTFAQGYGSYYVQCCQKLWDQMERQKLTTQDGTSIFKHLRKQGITERGACDPKQRPRSGTFEYRVKEIEEMYWDDWHPVFKQWKRDTYRAYCENGFIRTHTGFVCSYGRRGLMRRNEVTNYQVQGASFHCLLKTLIFMTKWLRKYKMKSKIVNQIYDSIIFCCHKSETRDVIEAANWYMTTQLPKEWPWLIIPLETEVESSDVAWSEKSPLEFK